MFSRRLLLFLFFIAFSTSGFTQKKDEYKQPRILILLDGSSSMVNDWAKGTSRFKEAGDIVLRLMDSIYSINDQVEFSLRVYGHEHGVPENNCFDTRREVMFSKSNYTQMSLRLANLHPMGVSPIAYSLKVAAETDFVNERDYSYSLVLITDGGESCGGDICNVVKSLLEKKIDFKPYIISLVDYAPLKEQYACLGTYLTAATPKDVAPAIVTITEAYRKILKTPIAKPKLLDVATIPSPSVQKITVPSVKVPVKEPETTAVAPPKPEIKQQPKPEPPKVEPKPQPKPEPVAVQPRPSKIQVDTSLFKKEKISGLRSIGYDRINYPLFWSTTMPKKKVVPRITLPQKEADPIVTTNPPAQTPTPKTEAPKQTPPPPIKKPTPIKPAEATKAQIKEATYTVKLEPAPETSLEIYFTDGKGKFYTTTPPIQLLDAKSGQEVKRFYRTVDGTGNPDPQKIVPGNYTMVIGKTGNYRAKSISIQPGNRNKVTVVVTKGTLIFRYDDNPKRPVDEFVASVRKTFESGTNMIQNCTEQREYEPGNYHIEISTLPMMVRNIDLDFGWSYTIDIPEPGFIRFTNTNAVGKVSLYSPLGDQFLKFYTMDVPGNPETQRVRLQPGVYEAHWKRNPAHPNEPEVVQKFFVKSNDVAELELK